MHFEFLPAQKVIHYKTQHEKFVPSCMKLLWCNGKHDGLMICWSWVQIPAVPLIFFVLFPQKYYFLGG